MTSSYSTQHGVSPLQRSRPARSRSGTSGLAAATRAGGALALLVTGTVHLQQFLGAHYSDIPTIGTLFALNFAGAVVLALALLAPLERLAGRRGATIRALAAVGGIALAATSIVFLLVSEHHTLFGFKETGYRAPIVIALVAEAATVLLLGCFLALRAAGGARSDS